MSDAQEAPAETLRLYDVATDQMRDATQADLDRMLEQGAHLGLMWADLRRLVAQTRAKMPTPFIGVTGSYDADGRHARDGEWLRLHLDGDHIRLSHSDAEDLIGRLQYALSRRKAAA